MNYADIKNRVETLRRELAEIAGLDSRYVSRKKHTHEEKVQHQQLQDRVRQIRNELYTLLERTKAA